MDGLILWVTLVFCLNKSFDFVLMVRWRELQNECEGLFIAELTYVTEGKSLLQKSVSG